MTHSHNPTEAETRKMAEYFRAFANEGLEGASPLYKQICLGISETPKLIQLASQKLEGQPAANVILACVHDLLLRGYEHPLRDFYPSCTDSPVTGDPFPAFQDFCNTFRADLLALIRTRRTQTNEVNRCAMLMPAFAKVMERIEYAPMGMIELGPSAGFNLNWDKYSYEFGNGHQWSLTKSPLTVSTTLKGDKLPPLPKQSPKIHSKVGIDLNPLDATDPEIARWLHALIWPEDTVRHERLQMAIQTSQLYPTLIRQGNAIEELPGLLALLPKYVTPVVYHSFVLYQFSRLDRNVIFEILKKAAKTRDLYRVSVEWLDKDGPKILLDIFEKGEHTQQVLGLSNAHGKWMEWLGDENIKEAGKDKGDFPLDHTRLE
jgi:hypothetical protein